MQHFSITEKLHTDILEEKYGPITAKVIKHTLERREALLVDSKGIARTYALTFIIQNKDKELEKINKKIKQGMPIGKAFRSFGYSIRKNVVDVFIANLSPWLQNSFHTSEKLGKARVSEFYALKKGRSPIIYGIVTEIYSPDFREPRINNVDKTQINVPSKFLEDEGISKKEIYRRIGDESNFEDCKKEFLKAKTKSKSFLKKLRKEIINELQSPQ